MNKEWFVWRDHSGQQGFVQLHMPSLAWVLFYVLFLSGVLTACSSQASLLPHALYYLEGWGEDAQIWKLADDGLTKTQLTFQPGGIDAFSVSASDGSLAFVNNNRLFITDHEGKNQQLIADASNVSTQIDQYYYHGTITTAVFSPDGSFLAYAFDGLHIYNLSTGEDEHVLKNLENSLGESYIFSQEAYYPESWSSDGSMLLISMGYYEGSTLAIMEMGEEKSFQRLFSEMPVCCEFSWSPDNAYIYVADPSFHTGRPGLWRYDAKSGEKFSLISDNDTGDMFYFVGWPQVTKSGELLFFYYPTVQFSPDIGIPLKLSRSQSDGTEIREVRPEVFSLRDVLWVKDDEKAVILGRIEGETVQMMYLSSIDGPLQILMDDAGTIHNLVWGP